MKKSLWTKDIVLTALAAALLSAGKQALAAIPNVEVVTLLIMLYAACFKPQIAFIATGVFIVIECFIWGIHTWVLAYIIHWNFVAFATFLLARVFKVKNRFIYLAFTIIVTACFGVLTTLIDAIIGAGRSTRTFSHIFVVTYVRGIYFYIVHVVGNAAFNIVLFAPMRTLLDKLMIKYYGREVFLREEDAAAKIKGKNVGGEAIPSAELTDYHECDKIDASVEDQGTPKGDPRD
ncbi:MAG: hypothetical protein J6U39_00485 [Clostridia bacterium]|nr:hypothetical protein [Clostridia bacterium]